MRMSRRMHRKRITEKQQMDSLMKSGLSWSDAFWRLHSHVFLITKLKVIKGERRWLRKKLAPRNKR